VLQYQNSNFSPAKHTLNLNDWELDGKRGAEEVQGNRNSKADKRRHHQQATDQRAPMALQPSGNPSSQMLKKPGNTASARRNRHLFIQPDQNSMYFSTVTSQNQLKGTVIVQNHPPWDGSPLSLSLLSLSPSQNLAFELSNMLAAPGFPSPLPCSQPQASRALGFTARPSRARRLGLPPLPSRTRASRRTSPCSS